MGTKNSNVEVLDTNKSKVAKKPTTVTLTLVGTLPMLQHCMTEAALDQLPGGSGKINQPNLKEMSYKERAAFSLYRGPNDELGITIDCLFGALVAAGGFVAFQGKKKLSNAEQSIIPSFMTIVGDFLPFKNQDSGSWTVDKRRGVNPSTGGAMCIIRPRFAAGWEIDVEIMIDTSIVKLETVRQLFDAAGHYAGIGSHRKKGAFGRFRVENWEVQEGSEKKAA